MAPRGRRPPPLVAVVGPSGAGKTTLLVALIGELAHRGYRVAAVKHSHHHDLLPDVSGKDSHRLWEAGAEATALVGPGLLVLRGREEWPLAHVLSLLEGRADIVLVEGYRGQPLPRIEVWRRGLEPPPWPPPGEVLAVVGDPPPGWQGPTFPPGQAAPVADLLERRLGLARP